MKTITKHIAAIFILSVLVKSISAQDEQQYMIALIPVGDNPKMIVPFQPLYKTAFGLRGGGTSGLTFKQFATDNSAVEGILGIEPNGMSITGLMEFYAPAGVEGLNWYYGIGGHAAFQTGRIYYAGEGSRYVYREGDFGLGVDGIIGIEYKIIPIPFAISLDLKPFAEVNTSGRTFLSLDPGLGVKFVF